MHSRRRYALSFKSLNATLGNIPLKEFQHKDLYRYADRAKRILVGLYPEVSLKVVRQQCRKARQLLTRDIDPSGYRKAQKMATLRN